MFLFGDHFGEKDFTFKSVINLKAGFEDEFINIILEKSPIFCSANIDLFESKEQDETTKTDKINITIINFLFSINFISGFFLLV